MITRPGGGSLDVTRGTIWRQLLALCLPVFLSSFFQQTYSLANALVVGRFAGTSAFAAIQATTALNDLVVGFSVGLGVGCGVVAGQYFGAHDDGRLSTAVHTAMGIAITFGLACSVAGVVSIERLLRLMGTPRSVFAEACGYGRVYMAAMVSSVVFNTGSALQRAVGDTRTPSAVVALTCVVNIVLDLLFVAVLHLGAIGCGLSTAASLTVGAAVTLWRLSRVEGPWRVRLSRVRIDPRTARLMARTGLPLAVQSSVYSVSNIIVQATINSFGARTIAAWGLSSRIDSVVWMVSEALGSSVTTFSAQNFGARNYARMGRGLRTSLLVTTIAIGALSALTVALAYPLASFFVTDDAVPRTTATMIRFIGPFYVFYSLMDNVSGTIRGAGESLRPMALTILGTCVFRVFWLLAVVPSHHTLEMVLLCYPVAWVLTAALFAAYYRFGHWREHAEFREAELLAA